MHMYMHMYMYIFKTVWKELKGGKLWQKEEEHEQEPQKKQKKATSSVRARSYSEQCCQAGGLTDRANHRYPLGAAIMTNSAINSAKLCICCFTPPRRTSRTRSGRRPGRL